MEGPILYQMHALQDVQNPPRFSPATVNIDLPSWQRYDEFAIDQAASHYTLHVEAPQKAEHYRRSTEKKVFELVAALILMCPALAATGLTAAAIKREDSGPVFYNSMRIGKDGNPIVVRKLRSMVPGANTMLTPGEVNAVNATDSDPRVTKVGKFIRATGVDELPQALDILKQIVLGKDSDLDVVAPMRAISQKAMNELKLLAEANPNDPFSQKIFQWIEKYPQQKPGLIPPNGPDRAKTEGGKKCDLDRIIPGLWYERNQSLRLDIALLQETVGGMFTKGVRMMGSVAAKSFSRLGNKIKSIDRSFPEVVTDYSSSDIRSIPGD